MQFLYHQKAGEEILKLKGEEFSHLKARRVKENEILTLRNLEDEFVYVYKISNLERHSCELHFLNKENKTTHKKSTLNLALAVIDIKILEKTLPFLNELGVETLHLVFTDFSQRNFKIDLSRFEKIIVSSCEQCGRESKMKIQIYNHIKDFYERFPEAVLVDFEGEVKEFDLNKIYFVGPEGGFSQSEKQIFKEKIGLKAPNILKSQTAIISIASKILL
ncbi:MULTISPECIES: 16S rRNA (uracil(1498)-N(3))-methyltransferase [Campylobacter]|uniref:Ribosomal RNA small subunit methyltransferase E n=1 Tax=Campylobacter taeniopygiae TaxID=2510188 RepID=A0ABY2TIY2_9BACT|nr:16S rRNA (uracil(1498)-N(3))-methyltransferase [Campylobacter taeniopygiae]MBZ7963958.1 16S rRNA (uracil(1498)-N(3))-methyltransferase [Campylobacter sp. 2457A]TKX33806.1 16S rRNA (uracil(1498)-N(3))-methyltransferase [Campylobacter taeniopygiae]